MKYRKQNKVLAEALSKAWGETLAPDVADRALWRSVDALLTDLESNLLPEFVVDAKRLIRQRDVSGWLKFVRGYADPQLYRSAEQYYAHAAIVCFAKKYPFGKVPGLDPLGKMLERLLAAEKQCKEANRKLRLVLGTPIGFRWICNNHPAFVPILDTARKMIGTWLGGLDAAKLNEIIPLAKHGPGGSIGVPRPRCTQYYKYAADSYTVTSRCKPYAIAAILSDPQWRRSVWLDSHHLSVTEVVEGSVPGEVSVEDAYHCVEQRLRVVEEATVTNAPKNAETHRAIEVPPLMNTFLQLAVGTWMRQPLKKAGLDLGTQNRNQQLARLGSLQVMPIEMSPVTMDLSMASDTLCVELVKALLPEDWFDFLWDLRCHYGRVKDLGDALVKWEKFSAMGTGFTFELESMIFYALSLSTVQHCGLRGAQVAVFGDDIIVPRGAALVLTEILNLCGFTVNTDKSFIHGPFRESCGCDYFEGVGVRPFYLKQELNNVKAAIYTANGLRSHYCQFLGGYGSFPQVASAYNVVLKHVPPAVRQHLRGPAFTFGPTGVGWVPSSSDTHLHSTWDEAQASSLVLFDRALLQWRYPTIQYTPVQHRGGRNSRYLAFREVFGRGKDERTETCDPAIVQRPVWQTAADISKLLEAHQFYDTWQVLASAGDPSMVYNLGDVVTDVGSQLVHDWPMLPDINLLV